MPIVDYCRSEPITAGADESIQEAAKRMDASGVGCLVVVDGERRIRHAYKPRGRIIEEPLARFVKRSAGYRTWKVSGFNLLRVVAPPGGSARDPRGARDLLR